MSAFNPNSNIREPDDWAQIAFKKASDTNTQWVVAGGIVAAAVAASATTPITGAFIAAWTIWSALSKSKEVERNQAAVREYRCLAHILDGDDFKDYARQAGKEALESELQFACDRNLTLSDSALDYVEDFMQNQPQQLLPAATPALGAVQPPFPKTLGNGGEAIIQDSFRASEISNTQFVSFDSEIPNMALKLALDLNNTLVVGIPGVGKGLLVTNGLDILKKTRTDVTVFYIDPKDDPKETGYFEGRVDHAYRLNICVHDPESVFEWIVRCLEHYDAFDAGNGFKLLVFDELAAIAGILTQVKGAIKWIKGKLVGYSSSGSSRGIVIWAVSQNAHVQNIGIDGGTRSIFTPIFMIGDKNIPASEALLATTMVPSDKKLSSREISAICQKSPVRRAIFHGGYNEWYPLPVMVNFSGYNRDERRFESEIDTNNRDALTADDQRGLQSRATEVIISQLEKSIYTNLDDFILKDLACPSRLAELKEAIPIALRAGERHDLLLKYSLS